MTRIRDATADELRASAEALREEREEADREFAPFLALQWAEAALIEEGALTPGDELRAIEKREGELWGVIVRGGQTLSTTDVPSGLAAAARGAEPPSGPRPRCYDMSTRCRRVAPTHQLTAWSRSTPQDASSIDPPGMFRFRAEDGVDIELVVAPDFASVILRSMQPIEGHVLDVRAGDSLLRLHRDTEAQPFSTAVDPGLGSDFAAALEEGDVWLCTPP